MTQTAGTKAPREEVQQRLLELLAEQSRRVPIAVGCLLVVVAFMAALGGASFFSRKLGED